MTKEHKIKIGLANSKSQIGNTNAKGHKLSDEWKKEHSEKISKLYKEHPEIYAKQRELAREGWTGENNPNWKGGITSEQMQARQNLQYIAWRNEVYRRDGWVCRICNNKDHHDIVAHHLKLFSEFPELRYSVDNGITLCRSCHGKLHRGVMVYE